MYLVPITTEKFSSIRSNTIYCIWNQWKSTLKERSSFCATSLCDNNLQYLARNLKADVNFKLAPSRNAVFNHQTGMDFVTEISFCKTPVVDEKRLVLRGHRSA